MGGVNNNGHRTIQSYLHPWERKLLDRIRQLKNADVNSELLIRFTKTSVYLSLVKPPERIPHQGDRIKE